MFWERERESYEHLAYAHITLLTPGGICLTPRRLAVWKIINVIRLSRQAVLRSRRLFILVEFRTVPKKPTSCCWQKSLKSGPRRDSQCMRVKIKSGGCSCHFFTCQRDWRCQISQSRSVDPLHRTPVWMAFLRNTVYIAVLYAKHLTLCPEKLQCARTTI